MPDEQKKQPGQSMLLLRHGARRQPSTHLLTERLELVARLVEADLASLRGRTWARHGSPGRALS